MKENLVSGMLVLVFFSSVNSYPMVGGSKRLQRAWAPLPLLYQRPTRPYYYDPYSQEVNEVDLYYPQDPYDKYRLYQMPYFLPEYLYDDDEEDEDQEGFYNNQNADANAIFLQNLIMSQMYRDALKKQNPDYDDGYVYGDVKEGPVKEDRDVQELKSLVGGKERRLGMENRKSKMENRWVDKRSETTTPPTLNKGQDEVVMPRPATPVRSYHTRSYQPSVYDTIKKLLIEQKNDDKRQPQKRSYVLNEDSLVQQLGNLKKN